MSVVFPFAKIPCVTVPLACMLIFLNASPGFGQGEQEQVRQLRDASNRAMKAYDHKKVLSFLTEDVLTTTGNGTLLTGRAALAEYIEKNSGSNMYFVRIPDQIQTGPSRAWEQGTWKGYDPEQGPEPVVGGNYAAMWVKQRETWRIKSQLFVTLE
ncbi:MAG: nuclear transport factor 2 family protein [Robiginitalea sp.]|nr:nuclear transport factor 2 family protein [Robiginitalea sp.]